MERPDSLHVRRVLDGATDVLAEAGIESPGVTAQLLLADVMGVNRTELPLLQDREISTDEWEAFRRYVKRRRNNEPVQYITGTAEFYSRSFRVDERVMIPRPETEVLVEQVLGKLSDEHLMARAGNEPRFCDLGTGSGVILITCCLETEKGRGAGVDVSEGALEVARENARIHDLEERVEWIAGDLRDSGLQRNLNNRASFDAVVSNPPYIEEEEVESLPPNVREFEPEEALVSPDSRNRFYEEVSELARKLLRAGGIFGMELSEFHVEEGERIVRESGFSRVRLHRDHRGKRRILIAQQA